MPGGSLPLAFMNICDGTEISAPEICTRLRAEDASRTVPIIMLSARGSSFLRGFSVDAGDCRQAFSMRD